jgi:hypothetical protein
VFGFQLKSREASWPHAPVIISSVALKGVIGSAVALKGEEPGVDAEVAFSSVLRLPAYDGFSALFIAEFNLPNARCSAY